MSELSSWMNTFGEHDLFSVWFLIVGPFAISYGVCAFMWYVVSDDVDAFWSGVFWTEYSLLWVFALTLVFTDVLYTREWGAFIVFVL